MASWRCSREGPDGLGLAAAATEPNLPDPTALAFSALTGGQVQFYAATAGRESAELVALSLGIETGRPLRMTSAVSRQQERRRPTGAAHRVVAAAGGDGADAHDHGVGRRVQPRPARDGGHAVAAFLSGTGVSVGQSLSSQAKGGPGGDDDAESDEPEPAVAGAVPTVIAPWERFVIGLDKALEQFWRENPNGVSGAAGWGLGHRSCRFAPSRWRSRPRWPDEPEIGPRPGSESGEPDRTENASPGDRTSRPSTRSSSRSGTRAGPVTAGSDYPTSSDRRMVWTTGRFRSVSRTGPARSRFHSDRIIREPRVAYQPARSSVGVDRRISAIRVKVLGRDKAEPAPALAFLVVATMAHEWVDPRRWHRAIRLGRPGAPPDSGKRGNPSVAAPKSYPAPNEVALRVVVPKGQNMTAQGNALGNRSQTNPPRPERA